MTNPVINSWKYKMLPTRATLGAMGSFKPPTIHTAVPPKVHTALTIVYTTLYSLLFLIVYWQLWMILCYRHRRFSYQTVFLFMCLLWSGLRTTLFSFYFNNCILANNLDVFPYWLLYCFPLCIQFSMLSLLVLYFGQVVFKALGKYNPLCYKIPLWIITGICVVIFYSTNIVCAVIAKENEAVGQSPPFSVILIRVIVNDLLFLVCGIALFIFLYTLTKLSTAATVLEAKGTTLGQTCLFSILIVGLFTSRAVYNLVVITKPGILSFGYGWINVSDQADFANLNQGLAYISFGIVLFVWELLPTFIVVVLFRVKSPGDSSNINALKTPPFNQPRAYFFDNPRRYDSDEDLSRSYSSRSSVTGDDAVSSSYPVSEGSPVKNLQHAAYPAPTVLHSPVSIHASN